MTLGPGYHSIFGSVVIYFLDPDGHILPWFENLELSDIAPRRLLDFRTHLQEERGLSLNSCRTIIDASFQAMMRDARKIDHLIDKDPFAALDWPGVLVKTGPVETY